ncbi:hypothetical protein [Streptomyces canus]|uniref:hypothetical protein n=1 Tax=Streptomyces canus TaxID=58343 RepID=UPI0027D7A1D5|nr:hypothetical protein [Streptomyces canus]
MDDQLSAALAAIQRVEEILYAHHGTAWAAAPETQEIRDAIADIDTISGAPDVVLGEAPPVDEYRLSSRPGVVSGPS